MTINIGNSNLPGVYTRQESNRNVAANVSAPADVGLVGEADLSSGAGSASVNTVYTVTTAPQAVRLFGDSPLAQNISDALQNGGYPVYSVAAEMTDVSSEDISGFSSTSGTLANFPTTEDMANFTITVDGTDMTTIRTFDDPSNENPASDEAYVNPTTGEVELGAAPASSGTISYSYADYSAAITALVDGKKTLLDFVGACTENSTVVDAVETAINGMANTYNFAIGVGGAASYIADTATHTNSVDNSRMQLVYPSRNPDGDSLIGAYVGMRGAIGINQSGMRQRLSGQSGLYEELSADDKYDLDQISIVVLETDRNGVRLVNDPTSVASDNTAEAAYNHGLARLIGDYVTLIVHENADRFIGKLHTQSARNNLRDILVNELSNLLRTDALIAYSVAVEEVDSVSARVEVGIDAADPLRNIEAIIVGGEVTQAVSA